MQSSPVLDLVRAATRDRHDRLEARLDVVARLASEDGHRRLWSRFYGFYLPAERALFPWLEAVPGLDYGRRLKSAELGRDLAGLGVDATALAALPRHATPAPSSTAQAIGAAYVMEGATLGGRVLRKALAARGPVHAIGFYEGYGDDTGPMWRRFCAVLEREGAASPETTAAAAEDAFDRLSTWLLAD